MIILSKYYCLNSTFVYDNDDNIMIILSKYYFLNSTFVNYYDNNI